MRWCVYQSANRRRGLQGRYWDATLECATTSLAMEGCLEKYFERSIDQLTLLLPSPSLPPAPSSSSPLSRYLITFSDQSQHIILLSHPQDSSPPPPSSPATSSSFFDKELYFYQKLSPLSSARVLSFFCSIPSPLPSHESFPSPIHQTTNQNLLIFNDLPLLSLPASLSPIASSQLNLLHLKAAVMELGKFHSSYFYHETPPPPEIPSPSALYGNYNYQDACLKFLETWDDLLEEYVEENEKKILVEVFQHCSQHVSNWTILLEMGSPCLVHGNYQPDNLIIQKGTDEESGPADIFVTLFNFQSIFVGKNSFLLLLLLPPLSFVSCCDSELLSCSQVVMLVERRISAVFSSHHLIRICEMPMKFLWPHSTFNLFGNAFSSGRFPHHHRFLLLSRQKVNLAST